MIELRLEIRPKAEHKAEMVNALWVIMQPARMESGFAASRIYQEVEDPESLCYMEEWDTLEQMEQQIRSRRFGSLLTLMETVPHPPVLEIRSISEIRGLDYISTLRLGPHPHNGSAGGQFQI